MLSQRCPLWRVLLLLLACMPAASPVEAECDLSALVRSQNRNQSLECIVRGGDLGFDRFGMTPLHWAAYVGDPWLLAHLIRAGADPGARALRDVMPSSMAGDTPLHVAARSGQLRSLAVLLRSPARRAVHIRNVADETALLAAARAGHAFAVRELATAGARVDESGGPLAAPAILYAVENDDLAVLQALLTAGGEPDASAPSGPRTRQTALHLSIERGQGAIAELVLASGGDANRLDSQGRYPLELARRRGDYEMVVRLKRYGSLESHDLLIRLAITGSFSIIIFLIVVAILFQLVGRKLRPPVYLSILGLAFLLTLSGSLLLWRSTAWVERLLDLIFEHSITLFANVIALIFCLALGIVSAIHLWSHVKKITSGGIG